MPQDLLNTNFKQAGKDKEKIPVTMTIDGDEFIQTLIKYGDAWRLYLNTPMRKVAKKEVGDRASFEVFYDALPRVIPMHPKLINALSKNKAAKAIYDCLRPSLQLEIVRLYFFFENRRRVNRNVFVP